MDWLLVFVCFGCIVFIGKVVLEHVYHMREMEPRIEELLQRAARLSEQAEAEAVCRDEVRARLPEQKEEVRRLETEAEDVRRLLQKAAKEQEVLDLKARQLLFRKGVRSGRKVAVRQAAAVAG